MDLSSIEAICVVLRDGGPLAVSVLAGYAFYQLVNRLETRIANLFDRLIGTTEKTGVALSLIADDMREIKQRLNQLK